MIYLLALLGLFVTTQAKPNHYLYGPAYGFRNFRAKANITSIETTLLAGEPPNPPAARMALWPGIETTNGDLIQPIIVSSDESLYTKFCGQGKWCVFASNLHWIQQQMGDSAPLSATEPLNVKIKYDEATENFTQTLSINSTVISTLSSRSGKAKTFYVQTECQAHHEGTVSAHKYVNTTIELENPDPEWGIKPNRVKMAKGTNATTSDGGKTWFIEQIDLAQSVAPDDYTN